MVADGSVVAAACSYLSGIGSKERGILEIHWLSLFFQDSSPGGGTAYLEGRSSTQLETFSRTYHINTLGAC